MGIQANKYLTFHLGVECYGISIHNVREIISLMDITPVPKMPAYVQGVINLRGKIIPVIDLRLNLGLEYKDYSERTCIIVIERNQDSDRKLNGLIVDVVSDVMYLPEDIIEPSPIGNSDNNNDIVIGLGKLEDGVVILINTDLLFEMYDQMLMNKVQG